MSRNRDWCKVFESRTVAERPVTVAGVKYLKTSYETSATVREVSHEYLMASVRDLWPLYP